MTSPVLLSPKTTFSFTLSPSLFNSVISASVVMETNPISTESFSHLLHEVEGLVHYPSPSMLCFENKNHKYSVGVDHSLSASSSSNTSGSSSSITKSKRNRAVESKKTQKKPKTENPTASKPVKVRKEKLGERIAALQQLVSPFGKTDTASVLHEAMGYIRFLHDQVQVLSSPYLKRPSSSTQLIDGRGEMVSEGRYDLRSRGLCLVPLEYTAQMASSNGADYWSAATMGNASMKH